MRAPVAHAQAKGGRAAKGGLITPSVPPPQKIAPPQGGKCKTPTLRQAKARAPDFSRNTGPSGLPQARGTPIEGPFFWPGGETSSLTPGTCPPVTGGPADFCSESHPSVEGELRAPGLGFAERGPFPKKTPSSNGGAVFNTLVCRAAVAPSLAGPSPTAKYRETSP